MKLKGNIEDLSYETSEAAGFDIRSTEDVVIHPGGWYAVSTGLYVDEAEANEYLQIVPRSGLAYRDGITVLNSPGTIDPDYTKEIKVILINHGSELFTVTEGMRIAQGILSEYKHIDNIDVSENKRSGGFGSTGVK